MENYESLYNKLTDEQKKKVKEAKTPEELLAIAMEAGYEVTEEQLAAIAGGDVRICNDTEGCPDLCAIDGCTDLFCFDAWSA